MRLIKGVTRYVILTQKWAIKFPSLLNWPLFLTGLLANSQEVEWSQTNDPRLCPVKYYIPGGWLVVMPRCEEVTEDDIDYNKFEYLPSDLKPNNFGRYKGDIVMIDYGS